MTFENNIEKKQNLIDFNLLDLNEFTIADLEIKEFFYERSKIITAGLNQNLLKQKEIIENPIIYGKLLELA